MTFFRIRLVLSPSSQLNFPLQAVYSPYTDSPLVKLPAEAPVDLRQVQEVLGSFNLAWAFLPLYAQGP